MRFWVGVTAAFGAGTLIGIATGTLLVEDKLKKEYLESTRAHWRMVQAVKIDAETPALDEEAVLLHPTPEGEALEGGEVSSVLEHQVPSLVVDVPVRPTQSDNPYHVAVDHSSNGMYVSYSVLTEEDYQEDDGRAKEQIAMTYSDGIPQFFMRGEEIDDAMERVGGTIVDDMRAAVSEGQPVLWMRNHQTDVDYEVVFEQP